MLFKKPILNGKLGRLFVKDKGAIAIITALVLTACIGFAALAIDVGVWHSQKRTLQMMADAGAAGGAFAIANVGQNYDTVAAYVTHDLTLNGCIDDETSQCSPTIIYPPGSGTKYGDPYSVEVILSQPAQLYLSGLFLGTAPTIQARAVAGQNAGPKCIITLGTAGTSLTVNGTATINASGCGLQVNSSANDAIVLNGGGSIEASPVNVVGNVSNPGNITGTVNTGASAVTDPYATFNPAPPTGACDRNNFTSNSTQTIAPGIYCGGIKATGGTLTMSPGVYYMVNTTGGSPKKGNFTVSGGTTIQTTGAPGSTTGVTIIMTQRTGAVGNLYGTVDITGGTALNLFPPTTGATKDILFYGDRNSSNLSHKFTGGNNQRLNGILYFPTSHLDYAGNQATTPDPCFQIIAQSITATGTTNLTFGCQTPSGSYNLFE